MGSITLHSNRNCPSSNCFFFHSVLIHVRCAAKNKNGQDAHVQHLCLETSDFLYLIINTHNLLTHLLIYWSFFLSMMWSQMPAHVFLCNTSLVQWFSRLQPRREHWMNSRSAGDFALQFFFLSAVITGGFCFAPLRRVSASRGCALPPPEILYVREEGSLGEDELCRLQWLEIEGMSLFIISQRLTKPNPTCKDDYIRNFNHNMYLKFEFWCCNRDMESWKKSYGCLIECQVVLCIVYCA